MKNPVKQVTKLTNGDLAVELKDGRCFMIAKDDEMFQVFVVWTVLEGV